MSRVMYNSKRLIPAPFVSISKDFQTSGDGTKIGSTWNISITGTIVAFKGSPNTSGVFWTVGGFPADESISEDSRLAAIIRKQEAIRELFSEDGHQLEFQSEDGSQPMKCNPRVISVSFSEGIWYDRCEYTIVCQTDVLYLNGQVYGEDDFTGYIDSASESWQIETQEEPEDYTKPRTYRLTHTVNAKGKRFFESDGSLSKPAWQQARDWVLPKLGFNPSFVNSSGVRDLPSYYVGYNHVRSENIDEYGGEYSITESWLLASGTATETFDINTTQSISDGLTKVTIDGNIIGYELRDSNMGLTQSKYQSASEKFTAISGEIFTRAQTYGGTSLNISPTSIAIGKNPAAGTIRYTYEYDNRPSNIIANARSETISIQDSLPTDFPVPIFVLGRTRGPVIQNLGTSKERTRALNVEAVMTVPSGSLTDRLAAYPDVSSIVSAAQPTGDVVYVQDRNQSWDISTGRYSYNITWIWE